MMGATTIPQTRARCARLENECLRWFSLIDPHRSSEGSLFAKRVAGTFVIRITLLATGFLTSVMAARLLKPEGRGVYGAALVLATIGSQFGNLGLHVSNTYYVASDPNLLPLLFSNSLLTSTIGGALISTLLLILFSSHSEWVPVSGGILYIVLLLIPATIGSLLLQNLLLGTHDVKWYNITEIVGRLAFLVLCGIFTVVIGTLTPEGAMILALISAVATFFLAGTRLLAITRRLPFPNLGLMRRQAAYGIRSYIICTAAYAVLKSDVLMVKYIDGNTAAGYYSLASNMTDFIYTFPGVVGMILFPTLTGTTDPVQRWRRARKTMLGVMAIMSVIAICGALAAKPVTRLAYGSEFLPAVPAFVILCCAIVFYGANNVVSIYFSSSGLPWFSVLVWPVAALFNVGLNLYCIPRWGIRGAAISSLVTYSALLAVQYVYALVKVRSEEQA
jgi:O-antigen/teichoic acid export membrane protein